LLHKAILLCDIHTTKAANKDIFHHIKVDIERARRQKIALKPMITRDATDSTLKAQLSNCVTPKKP